MKDKEIIKRTRSIDGSILEAWQRTAARCFLLEREKPTPVCEATLRTQKLMSPWPPLSPPPPPLYNHHTETQQQQQQHLPGQNVDDGQEHEHGHAVGHALGDEAVPVVPVPVAASAAVRNSQGADRAPSPAGGREGGRSRRLRCRRLLALILLVDWSRGAGSRLLVAARTDEPTKMVFKNIRLELPAVGSSKYSREIVVHV